MGGILGMGTSGCGCSSTRVMTQSNSNPDPDNFKILKIIVKNNLTLAIVKYPDCNNFEGKKLLLFSGDVESELRSLSKLDPHFCENDHLSPIARFKPDLEGVKFAFKFIDFFY